MNNELGRVVVNFKYNNMEEVEYVNIEEVEVDYSRSRLALRNSDTNLYIHIDLDSVYMFGVSDAMVRYV